MTTTEELLVEREDAVLRVTLNRPAHLNAANTAVLAALADTIDAAAHDTDVRAIVLAGAGKAFCSGADIGGGSPSAGTTRTEETVLEAANRAVLALRATDKPVVAAVHGLAAGVGASLALACDLVVAARSVYFLLAFTGIGLMPDGGATALIPAAIGRAKAMRMALLAEKIPADTAEQWGLVSHVVDDDQFADALQGLVTKLTNGAPLALAHTKHAINACTLDDLTAAIGRESQGQDKLSRTQDFKEGVRAFRDKRRPQFAGA